MQNQIVMRDYRVLYEEDNYTENRNVLRHWMDEHLNTHILDVSIPEPSENRSNMIWGIFILLFTSFVAFITIGSLVQSFYERIVNGEYDSIFGLIFAFLFTGSILGIFLYVSWRLIVSYRYIIANVISDEFFFQLYIGKKKVKDVQTVDINDIIGVAGFYSYDEGDKTGININLVYIFDHNPYNRRSTWNLIKFNISNRFDRELSMQFKLYRLKHDQFRFPEVVSIVLKSFSVQQELEAVEFIAEIEEEFKSYFPQFRDSLELNSYCSSCEKYHPWNDKFCSVCGNVNIRKKFIPSV